MTCIAWKDGLVAADRAVFIGNQRVLRKKLYRVGNMVVGWSGPSDSGHAVLEWLKDGAKPEEFPAAQRGSDYAVVFTAAPDRGVYLYYQTPTPIHQPEPFGAIGSGSDFALGAMQVGADPKGAVKAACELSHTCSLPIDCEAFR